jgi:hypothetical protein
MAQVKQDAIALLKADHRKVEELFEQFESARKTERKTMLAKAICTELTVHAMIEEEIFYPACTGVVEEDVVNEAYVEHDGAKVLISEINAGSTEDEFFDAKVKVLSELIKHHVQEEEKRSEGMFAQAKAEGVDLDDLGERLLARKEELMQQIERGGLPTPETRSYTGHKLKQGQPIQAAAE